MRRLSIAVVALAIPCVLHAQGPVASAAAVKWGPAPDFVPKTARFAVIQGDPSKSSVYTIRLRFPDKFRFPPHFHPTDEHVTVLAGQFIVGMGDTLKVRSGTRLTAGGFITAPAQAHHWAVARGVTIVQVSGEGPFGITYVNSADDPRNHK
ncbi:MAG TPA: cupin domain-containing protein [Gemmatimonadales bacterium]|nr:cupin domain-containing protein [Gemmatimonadales bacterium]